MSGESVFKDDFLRDLMCQEIQKELKTKASAGMVFWFVSRNKGALSLCAKSAAHGSKIQEYPLGVEIVGSRHAFELEDLWDQAVSALSKGDRVEYLQWKSKNWRNPDQIIYSVSKAEITAFSKPINIAGVKLRHSAYSSPVLTPTLPFRHFESESKSCEMKSPGTMPLDLRARYSDWEGLDFFNLS